MKKGLSMRKLREIFRLRFECQLTTRQISRSARVSVGAVNKYLCFEAVGLTWPLLESMDDTALINKLAPTPVTSTVQDMVDPDWQEVHTELKSKGMTKQVVWEEYCKAYPHNAYSYSQFCHRYRQWSDKQKRSMRQHHRAGEKSWEKSWGQSWGQVFHYANNFSYHYKRQLLCTMKDLTLDPS